MKTGRVTVLELPVLILNLDGISQILSKKKKENKIQNLISGL